MCNFILSIYKKIIYIEKHKYSTEEKKYLKLLLLSKSWSCNHQYIVYV